MDLFGNLEADLFRFIIRKSDCHESVSAEWSRTVIQRHVQNRQEKDSESDVRNRAGRSLIADGNGSGHKDSGNRESGQQISAEAFTHGRKGYV